MPGQLIAQLVEHVRCGEVGLRHDDGWASASLEGSTTKTASTFEARTCSCDVRPAACRRSSFRRPRGVTKPSDVR
jgi:hypothetical protein